MITRRLFSLGALATPLILRHPSYGRIVPVTGWTEAECLTWLHRELNKKMTEMLTASYHYEALPPEPSDVENRIVRIKLSFC